MKAIMRILAQIASLLRVQEEEPQAQPFNREEAITRLKRMANRI